MFSAKGCVSPAATVPWKKANRRKWDPYQVLVRRRHVPMRQACTLPAGSAKPSSLQRSAFSRQLIDFPAHGEADCPVAGKAASSNSSSGPAGASRHSRWGHPQTKWRTTSPRDLQVWHSLVGSSVVPTDSFL